MDGTTISGALVVAIVNALLLAPGSAASIGCAMLVGSCSVARLNVARLQLSDVTGRGPAILSMLDAIHNSQITEQRQWIRRGLKISSLVRSLCVGRCHNVVRH